jgi:hypothetical protein
MPQDNSDNNRKSADIQDENLNGKKTKNQSRDLEVVLKWTLYAIGVITVLDLVFLGCLFSRERIAFALGTYLLIAVALFVSGGMLGFLFGIPKMEKTIPVIPATSKRTSNFSDNANLEEISDWLTKIIVGLTLVQFNNIKTMLHDGARSINETLGMTNFNFYVFGYAMIIFYLAAGFLISYFWTRTNYVYILEKGKDDLSKIAALTKENENLKDEKKDLETEKENVETEKQVLTEKFKGVAQRETFLRAISETSNAEFKPIDKSDSNAKLEKIVNEMLESHKIIDTTDPHKNRWGGKSEENGRKLEAIVTDSKEDKSLYDADGYSLYDIKFTISSTDDKKPLVETVVLLLHDSFGKGSIVYLRPEKNKAEFTLPAYEAFTAAAICDNGTTFLELDLNNLPGNPSGFNY